MDARLPCHAEGRGADGAGRRGARRVHRRLPDRRRRARGLVFDYQLVDLGIAVVTIFFGRLGLQLASIGLKWPAFVLGTSLGAVGAAPLRLPSTFLHWFVVLAGVLIILRTIWPWANQAMASRAHSRARRDLAAGTSPSGSAGAAGRRRPAAVHAVRRPEDDGSRGPDPDLRHAGLGPEHRGRPRRPARSRLRRLLRRRRLFLCAAQHPVSAWASGRSCRSPA